jgi:C-terminal processing protease CtpA/Prc
VIPSVRESWSAHAKIVGRTSGGGLTEFSFVVLADGYSMAIPTGVVLGPVTGEDQPGHAIKPDLEVPNPSLDELLNGRDRQLNAARAALP